MSPLRAFSVRLVFALTVLLTPALRSAPAIGAAPTPMWDLAALSAAPEVFPSETIRASDERIRALFFAGPSYHGKPTHVFAWLGVPKLPAGQKAPGIVLLHGGGGTAFESWVKLWVDRGYAAIAIDSFGGLPVPASVNPHPRNPDGGPPGGSLAFGQLAEPLHDQWPYHAVADAILAHSLLRTQPGVDAERIGVTGISWGGYLTCVYAGVDTRLRFAAPVYGCGHYDDSVFAAVLEKLPPAQSALWRTQWDASLYLSNARLPMLWANGTNDHFFWLPAWQQSYRQIDGGFRTLALRVGMKHGHPPAGDPPEIAVFADSVVRDGPSLPTVLAQTRTGRVVTVTYKTSRPLARAELIFTADTTGPWEKRAWQTQPADVGAGAVIAMLPPEARLYFVNLIDDRGCLASSEHASVGETAE
jgi:dienelactone hydrolase